MNTTPAPPPIDEHDWQAQERLLATPPRRADALLARALGELPASQPPPGFAAGVARLAASSPQLRADDAGLERLLQSLLFAALAVGAAISALVYGGAIRAAMLEVLGAGASQWLLMGIACLALAATPDLVRRLKATPVPAAG